MKIRHGFVSNSSSTSFCIYGIKIETDEDISDLNDRLDELLTGTILEKEINWDSDAMWVGVSLSEMQDNETLKQFKTKVEKALEKIKLEGVLDIYEESWYDD